jgi:hypothetical protein
VVDLVSDEDAPGAGGESNEEAEEVQRELDQVKVEMLEVEEQLSSLQVAPCTLNSYQSLRTTAVSAARAQKPRVCGWTLDKRGGPHPLHVPARVGDGQGVRFCDERARRAAGHGADRASPCCRATKIA